MTTSIGSDRPDTRAIEFYPDAAFVRDDHKLYFGNGGDFAIWYDSTSDAVFMDGAAYRLSDNQKLSLGDGADTQLWYDSTSDTSWVSGRSIRTSDNFQIQFGNESDANLRYNAASDCFHLSGKTIKISFSSDLVLVGVPTSATGVVTGGVFTSDATGTQLRII